MTSDTPPGTPESRPPAPPASDAPAAPHPPSSTAGLSDFLRQRMEALEGELQAERERSRQAENLLRQQDALRTEVDKQLKALLEQLRQEKALREHEEEKARSRGRIDSLETRLDEMHKTWAGLLKESLARREAVDASAAEAGAAEAEELKALAAGLGELQTQISKLAKQKDEGERISEERLRGMISDFGRNLSEKLGDMDRRLALEMEKERERLDASVRERNLMSQTLEEERHRVRQAYAQELRGLQDQFNERLTEIGKALARIQLRQEQTEQGASAIKDVTERIHSVVTQPEAAKEQIIADLEREKLDLAKAMRERSEQTRRDALERREIEKSLGESLMELNRQLEAERVRYFQLESQMSELRLRAQAAQGDTQTLQGQLELGQTAAQAQEVRYQALARERDELVRALTEEAQKVQAQMQAKRESDQVWENRLAELNRFLEEERNARRADSNQIAELRSQVQTLTEHLTQTLREKEKGEAQNAGWSRERDELLAALRKKEEMIALLSSTFQNMLKK